MDEIQNPKSLINRDYEQIPLVSFDEWIESPERHSRLGVGIIIEPKDDIYLIKDQLEFIELIALDFSNFDDGRGYTQAYFLSKRWQYGSEIIGINAHLDQLQFMIRSGVTSYQLLD